MRVLRVNETKVTSGNAFIVHLFTLGGNEESKYDKKASFRAPLGVLTRFLKPSLQKSHVTVFLNYFSFDYSLTNSCRF